MTHLAQQRRDAPVRGKKQKRAMAVQTDGAAESQADCTGQRGPCRVRGPHWGGVGTADQHPYALWRPGLQASPESLGPLRDHRRAVRGHQHQHGLFQGETEARGGQGCLRLCGRTLRIRTQVSLGPSASSTSPPRAIVREVIGGYSGSVARPGWLSG